jgi:hypothetical protein
VASFAPDSVTPRELRLRERIDTLRAQRDVARAFAARIVGDRERVFRHCGYCGTPCWGEACPAHRDLLLIERGETRA